MAKSSFNFDRRRILPLFLSRQESTSKLARRAGTNSRTVWRAVNGLPISSVNVDRISAALQIDPMDFLVEPAQVGE